MDSLRILLESGREPHHAYILEGDSTTALSALRNLCDGPLGCPTVGNPDFVLIERDSLAVDDARLLRERQSLSTVGDGRMVVVAIFRAATREAQNALLKVLEEPATRTHIFLVVPYASLLLSTVRSRAHRIRVASPDAATAKSPWLAMSVGERLAEADKLAKAIRDGKKTKGDVLAILNSLERSLAPSAVKSGAAAAAAHRVLAAKRYLNDPGASAKLLLERVALALP